jgi:hypothetical protein
MNAFDACVLRTRSRDAVSAHNNPSEIFAT